MRSLIVYKLHFYLHLVNRVFTYDGQLVLHAAEVGVVNVSSRINDVPAMKTSNSERTPNWFAIMSKSRLLSPTEELPAIHPRFYHVAPRVARNTCWNLPTARFISSY